MQDQLYSTIDSRQNIRLAALLEVMKSKYTPVLEGSTIRLKNRIRDIKIDIRRLTDSQKKIFMDTLNISI